MHGLLWFLLLVVAPAFAADPIADPIISMVSSAAASVVAISLAVMALAVIPHIFRWAKHALIGGGEGYGGDYEPEFDPSVDQCPACGEYHGYDDEACTDSNGDRLDGNEYPDDRLDDAGVMGGDTFYGPEDGAAAVVANNDGEAFEEGEEGDDPHEGQCATCGEFHEGEECPDRYLYI